MPIALIIALAASFGIHVVALFGTDIELLNEPDTQLVLAELRPMPKALVEPGKKLVKVAKPPRAPRLRNETVSSATPVMSVPEAATSVISESLAEQPAMASEPEAVAAISRLPEHGRIYYRVDRGDQGFEIGKSTSEWDIEDGNYHLRLVTETSGLVWLFKSYRLVMESRGRIAPDGLKPEVFSIRRNGADAGENATFDWENMQIRVGENAPQTMNQGTQDLLSFNYQLGFMPNPEVSNTLAITTGKKYGVYQLETLGDEEIEIPAGVMRTLHLRAPGANTTELWLAYDYLLLPVKIRHSDDKGGSFVQVALQIQLSPQ
ncbi:MAG: DUF3108 domain-containing protein [Betaproteobacteria bacterium]